MSKELQKISNDIKKTITCQCEGINPEIELMDGVLFCIDTNNNDEVLFWETSEQSLMDAFIDWCNAPEQHGGRVIAPF